MNIISDTQKNNAELSDLETAEIIEGLGSLLFEAAFGRLLLTLDERQLDEVEEQLSNSSDPEALHKYLLATHPRWKQFVAEESNALEEKARALTSQ